MTMKCPEWRLICNSWYYWLFKIIVWITSGKWETLDYIVCGFHFLFVSNLIKTELGRGDPWKLNWENFIALSTSYFVIIPLNATPHDRWLRRISRNQWCGIRRVLVYFFNEIVHTNTISCTGVKLSFLDCPAVDAWEWVDVVVRGWEFEIGRALEIVDNEVNINPMTCFALINSDLKLIKIHGIYLWSRFKLRPFLHFKYFLHSGRNHGFLNLNPPTFVNSCRSCIFN